MSILSCVSMYMLPSFEIGTDNSTQAKANTVAVLFVLFRKCVSIQFMQCKKIIYLRFLRCTKTTLMNIKLNEGKKEVELLEEGGSFQIDNPQPSGPQHYI